MTLYNVELGANGKTRRGGIDSLVVSANDAAEAEKIAQGYFSGAASDAAWAAGTPAELAELTIADATALVGWRFRVLVQAPGTLATVADVTVTGDATNDTIDEIGAQLVLALNATASIANASYSPNTLTVAAIADGIGDHIVTVEVLEPVRLDSASQQINDPKDYAATLVGTITDEGVSGAALTVAFAADTAVVPRTLVEATAR